MKLDYKVWMPKILDKLTNYSHVAIGTGYAIVALAYHVKSGHDLGSNFVTFSAYFYGFLLGHAGVYQRWPDKGGDATAIGTATTTVDNTVNVTAVAAPAVAPSPADS
jgi:hypothetical protein